MEKLHSLILQFTFFMVLISLFMFAILTKPLYAYADIYYGGNAFVFPTFEIALLDNNANVSIQSEAVTFLSPSELKSQYEPALPTLLQSEYGIQNKGQNTFSRICIPLLGRITNNFEPYTFKAGDNLIQPKIYISKDTVSNTADFTKDILKNTFSDAVQYEETTCGTLYEFTSDTFAFDISFELQDNQKVAYTGFCEVSSDFENGKTKITCKYLSGNVHKIFLTSGTIDSFDFSNELQIMSSNLSYNEYLASIENIDEESTFYLYVSNAFSDFLNSKNHSIDLITSSYSMSSTRMIFLVYNVELKTGLNNFVVVRPIKHSKTTKNNPNTYFYRFDNSPFATWKKVGSLKINITTTDDLPYILNTKELTFKKNKNEYAYKGTKLSSYDTYEIHFSTVENLTNPNKLSAFHITLICIGILAFICLIYSLIMLFRERHRRY